MGDQVPHAVAQEDPPRLDLHLLGCFFVRAAVGGLDLLLRQQGFLQGQHDALATALLRHPHAEDVEQGRGLGDQLLLLGR